MRQLSGPRSADRCSRIIKQFSMTDLADIVDATRRRVAACRTTAIVWIPCLRKDFILYEFQLLEERANCADAVLLIVAALGDVELKALAAKAAEYELDVLCEVHDAEEVRRALDAGCGIIGVNNRD